LRGAVDKSLGRPGSGVRLALAAKVAEALPRYERSAACFAVWLPLLLATSIQVASFLFDNQPTMMIPQANALLND